MEDQKFVTPTNDALLNNNNKPRKKMKSLFPHEPDMFQSPPENMKKSMKAQKAVKKDVVPLVQQERLGPGDSSGNEYRALRRKYLLLEEESFGLGKELKEFEDEIKSLEEEKLSLLDELVVLEGLVDPSDQAHKMM